MRAGQRIRITNRQAVQARQRIVQGRRIAQALRQLLDQRDVATEQLEPPDDLGAWDDYDSDEVDNDSDEPHEEEAPSPWEAGAESASLREFLREQLGEDLPPTSRDQALEVFEDPDLPASDLVSRLAEIPGLRERVESLRWEYRCAFPDRPGPRRTRSRQRPVITIENDSGQIHISVIGSARSVGPREQASAEPTARDLLLAVGTALVELFSGFFRAASPDEARTLLERDTPGLRGADLINHLHQRPTDVTGRLSKDSLRSYVYEIIARAWLETPFGTVVPVKAFFASRALPRTAGTAAKPSRTQPASPTSRASSSPRRESRRSSSETAAAAPEPHPKTAARTTSSRRTRRSSSS